MEKIKSRNIRDLVNSVKRSLTDENDITAGEMMDIYNRNIEPQYYEPCVESVLDAIAEAYYFGLGVGQRDVTSRNPEPDPEQAEQLIIGGMITAYANTVLWLRSVRLNPVADDVFKMLTGVISALHVGDAAAFAENTLSMIGNRKAAHTAK